MNKSSALFLCLIVAGFGAVVYFEEQRIAELDRLADFMHVGAAELLAQSTRSRDEIRRLRDQVEVFKKESEQLRSQLASAKTAAPAAANSANPTEPGTAAAPAGDKKGFMNGLAKMFTDPEMKKSMRVQQMVGIRMMYGDVVKELGLSGADGEQLIEILADRQMDISAAAMSSMDPNSPDKDKDKDGKKMADTQKRYTEQLKAVLGDDRYKQFQTYEGSIGDRFMLQQFEGQFASAGSPLEPAQKDQLLGFMREERAAKPADSNLMNNTNPRQQMEAIKSDEAMGKFMTGQEDFNRRVMARARDVLNADQIAAFEKVQQQQLEFMKMQMKMSREMLGGAK